MNKDTDKLDNIGFIQYLNRKVLEEAEEAMTLDLPGDGDLPPTPVRVDDENAQAVPDRSEEVLKNKIRKRNILKRRNRMYGSNPLLWAFEKIADIEINIQKNRVERAAPESNAPPMDEKDAALVKHFLEKQTDN